MTSSANNAGSPATHFVATGRDSIDGASIWVEFRNGGCGWRAIGLSALESSYDGGSDTLTDDLGITWYLFP